MIRSIMTSQTWFWNNSVRQMAPRNDLLKAGAHILSWQAQQQKLQEWCRTSSLPDLCTHPAPVGIIIRLFWVFDGGDVWTRPVLTAARAPVYSHNYTVRLHNIYGFLLLHCLLCFSAIVILINAYLFICVLSVLCTFVYKYIYTCLLNLTAGLLVPIFCRY